MITSNYLVGVISTDDAEVTLFSVSIKHKEGRGWTDNMWYQGMQNALDIVGDFELVIIGGFPDKPGNYLYKVNYASKADKYRGSTSVITQLDLDPYEDLDYLKKFREKFNPLDPTCQAWLKYLLVTRETQLGEDIDRVDMWFNEYLDVYHTTPQDKWDKLPDAWGEWRTIIPDTVKKFEINEYPEYDFFKDLLDREFPPNDLMVIPRVTKYAHIT